MHRVTLTVVLVTTIAGQHYDATVVCVQLTMPSAQLALLLPAFRSLARARVAVMLLYCWQVSEGRSIRLIWLLFISCIHAA
jgi:hypothetical protein